MSDPQGYTAPGFAAVREAFADNFARHGESGAACCVYRDGRVVVDLWAGVADHATGRPWRMDTPVIVFSVSKGFTAAAVHLLVERGALDLDAPVARYWPAFAANGKGDIPLRWVLAHRAGLAAVDGALTLDEVLAWDPVVRAIAAQAPNWPPGSGHGYHARTFGWILGEVIRRVTGRSPGRFIAEAISGPLGLEFWIGLPAPLMARRARLRPPAAGLPSLSEMLGADSLTARVMNGPSGLFGYDEMWNRAEILAAEMPSSNGVGTARALARFYAALIGELEGRRLLRPETVARATEVQSQGADLVLMLSSCFGLGFMLQPTIAPDGGRRCFGHAGAGGSTAFADPEAGLAFGYVTSQLQFDLAGDPRSRALVRAVYASL
ncbi:beta-lactamase family protein [bacterium]|nr:beta-lactamase family protein [bacterium]